VKYAGAAYLIFLGIRVLRNRGEDKLNTCTTQASLSSIFMQGVFVNLFNPKTALFFLSYLPQFVSPAPGHATLQVFQLGVLFTLLAWLSDSAWALLAGTIAARLRSSPRLRRARRHVSGGALIALGLASAFSGARTK
jgi:threonine/homoserine/homoserine lactone efflux protein